VTGKERVLDDIRADGARVDISCYWLSNYGHGGPILSQQQTTVLAAIGLDVWFDVYLAKE